MKILGNSIIAIVAVAFGLPFAVAQPENPAPKSNEMTVWSARHALVADTGTAFVYQQKGSFLQVEPSSVHVASTGIVFNAALRGKPADHFTVAFSDLAGGVKLVCPNWKLCELAIGTEKKLPPSVPHLIWNDELTKWGCSDTCRQQGTEFAAALNRLAAFAADKANPLIDFPAQAAAWRALATKPPLPDAARVRSLLAEDAVSNKKPQEALNYYQQALDIYALWPQGWFNSALISAELGDYDGAAEYMRNYLLLVPDAPDARQAHDQLEMWKIKASEK